jgi:hypothetical protein
LRLISVLKGRSYTHTSWNMKCELLNNIQEITF